MFDSIQAANNAESVFMRTPHYWPWTKPLRGMTGATSVSSGPDAVAALLSAASHVRSFAKTWNGCLQHNPFRKGARHDITRQRMIEDMQIRNLAVDTQNSYVLQVSMFARHFGKSRKCWDRRRSAPTRSI